MNRADEGPSPANCILCGGLTGPGCPCHGRRFTTRAVRAAALLLAAIAAVVAVTGCQAKSAAPAVPTSFWPCPAGHALTEHYHEWGCFK